MLFNFGDTPFKFEFPQGFKPVNTVSADLVVVNNSSGDATASVKPANNAPQAIIIEVIFLVKI